MFREGEKVKYVITEEHNGVWHTDRFLNYISTGIIDDLILIQTLTIDIGVVYYKCVYDQRNYTEYFKEEELKKYKKLLEDV